MKWFKRYWYFTIRDVVEMALVAIIIALAWALYLEGVRMHW